MMRKIPGLCGLALTLLLACAAAAAEQLSISAVLNYQSLQPGQQAVVAVVVDIKPGFHAQSNTPLDKDLIPFEVVMEPNDRVEFMSPRFPPPDIHTYPALGKVSVYTGQAIIFVPLQIKSGAATDPIEIKGIAKYQVCDDQSCFAPEESPFSIETTIEPAGAVLQANRPELFAKFDPTIFAAAAAPSAGNLFGFELTKDAYVVAFLGALVVGMIFNVMPCVLPIVPLKAMGFYQAGQEHRSKSIALGAVFALGIIATFGALAVPVVVLRTFAWGELFGNAWFAGAIVVVLTVMAAGTFGLFNVVLPSKVYEMTPTHETYAGNFLFGILTAVLSTPCTFGMFLGLLVWAATQPAVLGTTLVMTVGLGMALPYLVLAAFPELARRFPRTGFWAEIVKQMMAFLLLATAVYFGRRFLPESLRSHNFWWLVFAVIAASGLFLVARTLHFTRRAAPVIVAVVVALLLVGPTLAVTLRLTYVPIHWVKFSKESFDRATHSGKPVLVKFTADWCGNCQAIEATVYTDDRTVKAIEDGQVVPLKADLTDRSAPGWVLLRSLHPVGAIPFTAVYLPGAAEPQKLAGIYGTDELLEQLASKDAARTAPTSGPAQAPTSPPTADGSR